MSDAQLHQKLYNPEVMYEKNYLTIPILKERDSKSTSDGYENKISQIKNGSQFGFNKLMKMKNFINSASNYWFKVCKK